MIYENGMFEEEAQSFFHFTCSLFMNMWYGAAHWRYFRYIIISAKKMTHIKLNMVSSLMKLDWLVY
jgi:hypothetical protein